MRSLSHPVAPGLWTAILAQVNAAGKMWTDAVSGGEPKHKVSSHVIDRRRLRGTRLELVPT